jgi:hypothetical protein
VVVLGETVETLDRASPLGAQKSVLPSSRQTREEDVEFLSWDEVVEVVFQPCESSGVSGLCPASAQTKNGASEISRVWDEKKFEIEIAKEPRKS